MDSSRRAQGKKKLEVVSEIVTYGGTVRVPIWILLDWFGHERRGLMVVGGISRVLKECWLETHPDFTNLDRHVSNIVEFRSIPRPAPSRKKD